MRGAGMVRRGMGFGFEPAGCWCKQPGLCQVDSSLGNYYDVTFTGIPSSATCDEYPPGVPGYCKDMVYEDIDLNHTYRLVLDPEYMFPYCTWKLSVANAYTLVDCYNCNGYWTQDYPFLHVALPYSFGVTIIMRVHDLYGDSSKIEAQIYITMDPNPINQATSDWYTLDKGVDGLDGWTGSGDMSVCCQSEMFANWSWSVQRAA